MSESGRGSSGILGVSVGIGLVLAGWLVGSAIRHFKDFERYVTVKGLAEREVAADLAIWPIVHSVSGNDLTELQARLEGDAAKIEAFLLAEGFARDEISRSAPLYCKARPRRGVLLERARAVMLSASTAGAKGLHNGPDAPLAQRPGGEVR